MNAVHPTPTEIARAFDVLGRLFAVLAAATERGDNNTPQTFDSRRLPPGVSRRRFAELCRSGNVVGARREGRDWLCTRAAWESARTRKRRTSPPLHDASASASSTIEARADALLARSNLRVVRGTR